MATVKFSKEFMQGVLFGEDPNTKIIENNIVDTTRWSIIHELVFSIEGKYYKTDYSEGATECQDERPWEYDKEVECTEVHPVEKLITIYKPM
jgi:hypothetical protein